MAKRFLIFSFVFFALAAVLVPVTFVYSLDFSKSMVPCGWDGAHCPLKVCVDPVTGKPCAGNGEPNTNGLLDPWEVCTFNDFIVMVGGIINFIIILASVYAAVSFMYAGYAYLTSGGSQEAVSRAKSIFKKVFIGYIIVLTAWLMIYTIEQAFYETGEGKPNSFLTLGSHAADPKCGGSPGGEASGGGYGKACAQPENNIFCESDCRGQCNTDTEECVLGGNILDSSGSVLYYKCQSKELPPQPPPEVDKYAFRVFIQESGGSGTVTATGDGVSLNCAQSFCTVDVEKDKVVTLTASAGAGSVFSNWGNACSGTQGNVCTVTMDGIKSVVANFGPLDQKYTISVQKLGLGSGIIRNQNGTILCSSLCELEVDAGDEVILNATNVAGSYFYKWEGACTGSYTECRITMNSDKSVRGTFLPTPNSYVLYFVFKGQGEGSIRGSLGSGVNFSCSSLNGSSCYVNVIEGETIEVRATAESDSKFGGWGSPCGGTGICTFKVNTGMSVDVSFDSTPLVRLSTSGNGYIAGNYITGGISGTINCDQLCADNYPKGTDFTIRAVPDSGNNFVSWSGCDEAWSVEGANYCTFRVNSNRNVTANFSVITASPALVTIGVSGSGGYVSGGGMTSGCFPETSPCSITGLSVGNRIQLNAVVTNPDYEFYGWSGACSEFGKNTSCSLTLPGPVTIYASFVPK
ncbi:MAG: hypothetical protein A3B08_03820 [Candidatus Taylorbacteria bacterium RIFCSPLOWO2_01_FULL_43_44]|uniref:Bacterial repeat domain-containing protein n=1 Tax=Candidatus Taylorbacteria bacterium RIFCSPHIGHO2_02_FULL_43_32b TaxID=1802306 RepID=A0A1G2MF52_9BACT|nr:MAG: hypothetical protein A2743_00735 [Candidatus Taylorbacteria bacterium RIFCSPHIGHO2_01_FULL_43_47]OHA22497.1 MAG: hypothetical protein A3C72_00170 [Candidatus Taylorbacteria bacterium RIFCSPHIGHO2_02_FULL_43_32b]OHA29404.1 MAG: hypothetical protein A3B08_03820 [Candidatus Taylorbacteria bacterium RIFCSPLOWO2_01_FULL_43_44]